MDNKDEINYHEIDFLLPAQRFNIQFSYVSEKGLPFIREFILRLINVSPMSRTHIARYFGLSKVEAEEAISDLVQRGELTLSDDNRLTLTAKSETYFSDIGDSPTLRTVLDYGAQLPFDLATFSHINGNHGEEKWNAGLTLDVDSEKSSRSESLVSTSFQDQFHQILELDALKNIKQGYGVDRPIVYTVNSVTKIRQFPLRLKTEFRMDGDGTPLERNDYEDIIKSSAIHQLVAQKLASYSMANNMTSIFKSMMEIGDDTTSKLLDSATNLIRTHNSGFIESLGDSKTSYFVGPVYSTANWDQTQAALALSLLSKKETNSQHAPPEFRWIGPSDHFWSYSNRFTSSLSDFVSRRKNSDDSLNYDPYLYVPITNKQDHRAAKKWINELASFQAHIRGISEGFLDGNVEALHLDGEFVVVIYHCTIPEHYPVPIPLGFISNNEVTVNKVGGLISEYLSSQQAFDSPNDCGPISKVAAR